MPSLKSLLISAAATSALLLHPRDSTTSILPGLKTIDSLTLSFTKQVNSYTGGLQPALPQPNYYQQLDSALIAVQHNASSPQSRKPYPKSSATAICNYSNTTLASDTQALCAAFISKKKVFVNSGLKQVVIEDLGQLKSDTDKLLGTLVSMSPGGKQAACSAAVARIDRAYGAAVAAYASG